MIILKNKKTKVALLLVFIYISMIIIGISVYKYKDNRDDKPQYYPPSETYDYSVKTPSNFYFFLTDETGGAERTQSSVELKGNVLKVTDIFADENYEYKYQTKEFTLSESELQDFYKEIISQNIANLDYNQWSEEIDSCHCQDCGIQAPHIFKLEMDDKKIEVDLIFKKDCYYRSNLNISILNELAANLKEIAGVTTY